MRARRRPATARRRYIAPQPAAHPNRASQPWIASYNSPPMRRILVSIILSVFCAAAMAQEEIQFWHSMDGALGRSLDGLVQRFNASQAQIRVVPTYKGNYARTMTDALAAQRDGKGPHVVQIYELGTAQMMYTVGAVRPVWQVFQEAGEKVDTKMFLPAVGSYFADLNGNLQALPFNVSTPILFYNRDAFRKAKLDPEKAP